jgi:hypothetical protein
MDATMASEILLAAGLAGGVFLAALVANLLAALFEWSRFTASVLAGLFFTSAFVAWTYYPIGLLG